jgi:hypothetical protein
MKRAGREYLSTMSWTRPWRAPFDAPRGRICGLAS